MVRCLTPNLMFLLKKDVPSGPWLVSRHGNDRRQMDRFNLHISVHVKDFVDAALQLIDLPVKTLLEDPHFKITDAKAVTRDGLACIEFSFDLQGSSLWYESGRMVLCPELDWAVRECEVNSRTKTGELCVTKGTVLLDRWPGGFVFPRRVVHELRCAGDHQGSTEVEDVTFHKVTPGAARDEMFTLAAFEVPELPLGPVRPSFFSASNWLFWTCLAVGVGCLVLLLRMRPRR